MPNWEMSWSLTMLFLHLLAFAGCLVLYPKAPCWMQRIVIGMLLVTMLIIVIAYAMAVITRESEWLWLTLIALVMEHLAILLYIFRLNFQVVLWPKSSVPSRS